MAPANPLQGQQLPSNWRAEAQARARAAEASYLDRLQNAWQGSSKTAQNGMPAVQSCRLRQDSLPHHPHNGGKGSAGRQDRFDGQMVLVEERADGWQHWRDSTTGVNVWRRIGWEDVYGRR